MNSDLYHRDSMTLLSLYDLESFDQHTEINLQVRFILIVELTEIFVSIS